jgi:hypothetical protein
MYEFLHRVPFIGIGLVVQLVRIHACHAWGREFESRPDRQHIFQSPKSIKDLGLFFFLVLTGVLTCWEKVVSGTYSAQRQKAACDLATGAILASCTGEFEPPPQRFP